MAPPEVVDEEVALRVAFQDEKGIAFRVEHDRLAVAHLHGYLAPFRARLDAVGGVEAEDVLGAELVLDVVIDLAQVLGALDVVDVPAGLAAEAAELVARVDLGAADADADAVDR